MRWRRRPGQAGNGTRSWSLSPDEAPAQCAERFGPGILSNAARGDALQLSIPASLPRPSPGAPMNSPATRTERDTFGSIEVPADRLWGAQTQRSLEHFRISTEKMPQALIRALLIVKRSAARVNIALGTIDKTKAEAIIAAADEALAGEHADEFPLAIWQTGSGTQTNMNVNEVLANRASELLGGPRGKGRLVHPNDHVNLGQSSNDVFPTAMHVAAAVAVTQRLLPALQALSTEIAAQSTRHARLVKIGRTHLQDATPLTLGQEF